MLTVILLLYHAPRVQQQPESIKRKAPEGEML